MSRCQAVTLPSINKKGASIIIHELSIRLLFSLRVESKGMTDKAGAATAGPAAEDDELSVPRASVNKMIRELAPNMRISNETRELIINCCNEFIHLVASESNEVCNNQAKKTIAPEHVLVALENLGFKSYLSEVKECVDEAKEVALKKRRQSTKLENLGIPEEELLRQQQELFAKAREEQAAIDQQEWAAMQQQANLVVPSSSSAFSAPTSMQQYQQQQPVSLTPIQPAGFPQPAFQQPLPTAGLVPATIEDDDDDY